MENLKSTSRIFLGLTIALSGCVLFFTWDPTGTLPNTLQKLSSFIPFATKLIPYHIWIFKINTILFIAAGFLLMINNYTSILLQILGAFMFCVTYDNPILASKPQDKMLRCEFIICHLVIISCMMALKDSADSIKEAKNEKKDK